MSIKVLWEFLQLHFPVPLQLTPNYVSARKNKLKGTWHWSLVLSLLPCESVLFLISACISGGSPHFRFSLAALSVPPCNRQGSLQILFLHPFCITVNWLKLYPQNSGPSKHEDALELKSYYSLLAHLARDVQVRYGDTEMAVPSSLTLDEPKVSIPSGFGTGVKLPVWYGCYTPCYGSWKFHAFLCYLQKKLWYIIKTEQHGKIIADPL